jgi:enamine deaminase RidA (YjgF/YER057c/UK114 family)
MRRFITQGAGLPRWSVPISHAVVVDDICYLSGQLSVEESGAFVAGTALQEAQRAFANLFSAIHAAEFAIGDLVFVDIAFIDLADVAEINGLYAELFPETRRPARTIYQAAALPFGGRVKVMGVAIREREPV